MPIQTWRSVLAIGEGAAGALASSASLTDISPAPQVTITANYFYIGQRFKITGYGIYSTTSNPTLTLGAYWGGVAGTALAVTAANATASNAASYPWRLDMDMYVRTLGTSGSAWCNGTVYVGSSLTAYTGYWIPSSQTQPVTINTTTANALTIGAQWGTSNSSNSITCEDLYVEALS